MTRSFRTAFLPLLLLAATACSDGSNPGGGPDPNQVQTEEFGAGSLSRFSSVAGMGYWRLEAGELVGQGAAGQNTLRLSGVRVQDGWVETTTSHADDGGIVLRYQSETDHLLLAIRDDAAPFPRGDRNLLLYRRDAADFHEVAITNLVWPRGTSRTVRVRDTGTALQVYVDGVLVATHEVGAAGFGGGIGLRHYGSDTGWTTRYQVLRWKVSGE